MTEEQKDVAELAAKIVAGILAGRMASNPQWDIGNIRPMHVSAAINVALGLIDEVKRRVPAEPNT